ncbi:HAD-IA family hydrolase [Cellulosimicrobium funkei]|uniref:HAD-IA family hydrolase n=1 Tax=Cellulosimicrobium TaxID=157920 RepID=UPI0014599C12|nr:MULTISPECIES: HAD-IA family hydrolase [Cellulosimicrobium]MCM3533587.1 HAD-IA family hydrolase [Cellulosimicrobium funkei]NMF28867.1 HAD-IA family hydrolase [Cellulosimicrobium aquatile]
MPDPVTTPATDPAPAPLPTPGVAFAGRTFDAVLFDMDGTLIDSVPAVDRNWRRWAAEHGLPDAEDFQIQHGTPARTLIATLLPADQVEPAYDRIHELELEDNEGVTILPGTRDALAALPPQRQAIVTSCTRPLAAARMAASGLVAPSVVVTADDVAHGKPDPDPFLLGAERLGVDPARCLVVEDAPAGVASARAAGCAVLVVTGTHTADELASASPAPDALAAGLAAVRFAAGPDGIRITDA